MTDSILKYKSLSIIGTEKNTGKTETLNFILNELKNHDKKIAVTSIGVDGENVDIVTNTQKPEIFLKENTIFITSEKHFREKKLTAEIFDISKKSTSLGRLVIAKTKSNGSIILSGPSDTQWLKEIIQSMDNYAVDLTIVDGALSRKSLASPSVTEAMILNTGAAFSANISTLITNTKFLYKLINIEKFENETINSELLKIDDSKIGIWSIDKNLNIKDLEVKSTVLIDKYKDKFSVQDSTLYINGIITNKILEFFRHQKNISQLVIIVKDFTKIFASMENVYSFFYSGGKIKVLYKTNLLAICINPTSPSGYVLNSEEIIEKLKLEIAIPIYDIKKILK